MPYAKFEVAEAARGRPTGHRNFGLTVMEAENSRSPNVPDMGIYDLVLTSSFQNGQKRPNRTKIDELSLHKHLQIFDILKIIHVLLIKVRQVWAVRGYPHGTKMGY